MKLIFDYPENSDSLEITLATKAYEDIWRVSGEKIVRSMAKHTGLNFQQDEIHVVIHDGQSMSGKDGVPMRLNVGNTSVNQKRNALVHELGHRLLFGNGLYAPESEDPDEDETRVFLFQAEVLKDVFGKEAYDFWADTKRENLSQDHQRLIAPVLKLSTEQRHKRIRQYVKAVGS